MSSKSPLEFAKSVGPHRHMVLFYEEIEYARAVVFEFLKAGIERQEHSFYICSSADKDFLETEFNESSYGPRWRFNYNFLISMKLIDHFLHIENTFDLTCDYKRRYYSIKEAANLIKGIKRISKEKQRVDKNNNKNSSSSQSRVVLQCIDKIETADQTQNIVKWEKNFRNSRLRESLSDTSFISMYHVDDNIEALKGESLLYSPFMKELIEIYDGVIFANSNWQGATYDFIG